MSDPKNLHFVKVKKGAKFADPELEAFEFDAKELLRAYNDAKKPFETIKKELRILIALKVILKTDELSERDNVISNNEVLRQLSVALNCDRERGDVLASLLRKRYPVAMIDEFQDTDPVQFAVFSKLYLTRRQLTNMLTAILSVIRNSQFMPSEAQTSTLTARQKSL